VDPSSRFLYIGETATFPSSTTNSGGLRAMRMTTAPLAATELAGSPYASGGTGPRAITPNAAGDYVYVASVRGNSAGLITSFQVSAAGTTYQLAPQTSTVSTGILPVGMVEDNLSHFMLAVSSGGSPAFNAYVFDPKTIGQLDQTHTDSTASAPVAIVSQ
jgi:6-phosphogluconolactonase (cycloisomerase 2 family)